MQNYFCLVNMLQCVRIKQLLEECVWKECKMSLIPSFTPHVALPLADQYLNYPGQMRTVEVVAYREAVPIFVFSNSSKTNTSTKK